MDDHFHEGALPDAAQLEATRAEIAAFRETNPTLSRVDLAVAFVEDRARATSAELHTLMGLAPDEYASSALSSALRNGRLAKDGKNWMPGPKAFPDTRESEGKQGALPPTKEPLTSEKDAGKPLQALKKALVELPPAKPSRCRFAVWSDGQVEIKVPEMPSLELSRAEFDDLVRFVTADRADRAD